MQFAPSKTPLVAFLLQLQDWEACPVKWMSPLGQYYTMKDKTAFQPGRMRIRPMINTKSDGWRSLAVFAADNAFGKLPQSTLRMLALELGCDSELGDSLFSVALALVMFVKKCTTDVALDILLQRCFPSDSHHVKKLIDHSDD